MSENFCEHPHCKRSIIGRCSNHCQLDLCQEHLLDHRNLFLVQYEKKLKDFHQTIEKTLESVENCKGQVDDQYQKDLLAINQQYNNELNLLEEKSAVIHSMKLFLKNKVQLLNEVKSGQAILHQHDVEQLKLYRKKIFEHLPQEIEMTSNDELETDCTQHDEPMDDSSITNETIEQYRDYCPLTHHGVFGLTAKHNVRLCPSTGEPPVLDLAIHFYRYHHLTWSISKKLTKLLIIKADPSTTPFFQSHHNPVDKRFYMDECPMNKIDGFRQVFTCQQRCRPRDLKEHLSEYHRLTMSTTTRILNTIQKDQDLHDLDLTGEDFQ